MKRPPPNPRDANSSVLSPASPESARCRCPFSFIQQSTNPSIRALRPPPMPRPATEHADFPVPPGPAFRRLISAYSAYFAVPSEALRATRNASPAPPAKKNCTFSKISLPCALFSSQFIHSKSLPPKRRKNLKIFVSVLAVPRNSSQFLSGPKKYALGHSPFRPATALCASVSPWFPFRWSPHSPRNPRRQKLYQNFTVSLPFSEKMSPSCHHPHFRKLLPSNLFPHNVTLLSPFTGRGGGSINHQPSTINPLDENLR
jgi:hypothetical protein